MRFRAEEVAEMRVLFDEWFAEAMLRAKHLMGAQQQLIHDFPALQDPSSLFYAHVYAYYATFAKLVSATGPPVLMSMPSPSGGPPIEVDGNVVRLMGQRFYEQPQAAQEFHHRASSQRGPEGQCTAETGPLHSVPCQEQPARMRDGSASTTPYAR